MDEKRNMKPEASVKHAASYIARLILVTALCFIVAFAFAGCGGSHSNNSSKNNAASKTSPTYPKAQTYGGQPYNPMPQKPTYEDSRWPTRNSQLLAIPESERWYNAWDSADSYCTIAGPVVNVYQAKESNGMPIFIDIGTAYPNSDSVSLVVWAYQYDEFAQMINEVDDGGAWISVTGYLSVYNGSLQFNAGESHLEYTWWTHVS